MVSAPSIARTTDERPREGGVVDERWCGGVQSSPLSRCHLAVARRGLVVCVACRVLAQLESDEGCRAGQAGDASRSVSSALDSQTSPVKTEAFITLKSPFQGSQSFMILTGVVSCVVVPLPHAHSPDPLYILVWVIDAKFLNFSLKIFPVDSIGPLSTFTQAALQGHTAARLLH